eukprot:gene39509-48104_t
MKDFEILCRASAFLVPTKNKDFSHRYHLLTVSHAAAPWRWPKLFGESWLQFVNEKHCHYTTELRFSDGNLVTQMDLSRHLYLHPTRDLAVLHLEEEKDGIDLFKSLKLETENVLLPADAHPLRNQTPLWFHGHEVREKQVFDDEENDKSVVPLDVQGHIYNRSAQQIFCHTKRILPLGMCGGPVKTAHNEIDRVVGLLEGIVPAEYPVEDLQNKAVYMEAKDIQKFLDAIENGEVQKMLCGDEAFSAVGLDQDPSKMDMSKIIS